MSTVFTISVEDVKLREFVIEYVNNIINYTISFLLSDEEEEELEEKADRDEFLYEDDTIGRWSMVDTLGHGHLDTFAFEVGKNKYEQMYNYTKLCSKAFSTKPSIIPNNLLTLYSTYGYACKRLYNLIAVDSSVLAYMAGNYVAFYYFKKHKKKYLRSIGGTGISAITMDSEKNFFAVGEGGNKPTISIFLYPSIALLRILRNGTEKEFAYLDFNADSTLLASLGGEPDYTLAIWDWKNEMITWRSKAFSQDVFKVAFSTEFPDKLITSGVGHIKFWTMADTFTGCKLQGVLGKFGHVELSDIKGFAEISGDRAISGSEWGNILLWEDGICVAEITRKGKNCHEGSIEQIINDNGSILSVGLDGVIKVWDVEEKIGERDIELLKWEMDPLDEMKIGKKSELTYLVKVDKATAPDTGVWLVQDQSGAIWMIDLSFRLNSFEPRCLISCHAGCIYACVSSPVSHLFATAGEDCTIRVYDYSMDHQLLIAKYNSSVTSIIWLPVSVDQTGGTLVAGFSDGVVRMLRFQQKAESTNVEMMLCDVIKPHNESVTRLSYNEIINLLASGSKDKTVFLFKLSNSKLQRIGFVQTEEPVTNLTWTPAHCIVQRLLAFCEGGKVVEFNVDNIFSFDNSQSYHLSDLLKREFQFKSRKLISQYDTSKSQKSTEQSRCLECYDDYEEMEEDEEEDVESEEFDISDRRKIEDCHDKILFGLYDEEATSFWISVDGEHAGALHECNFDVSKEQDLLDSVKLTYSLGIPVHCYLMHMKNQLLFFGTASGSILAYDISEGKLGTSMDQYYMLNVLDSKGANIMDMCLSSDEKFLFIVGRDGNIFQFKVFSTELEGADGPSWSSDRMSAVLPEYWELPDVEDITDSSAASLEDSMTHKRLMEAKIKAEENKKLRLETLKKMQKTYKELLTYNLKLPPHLRLYKEEFEMDPSFEIETNKKRDEMIDAAKKQMLFETIRTDITLGKVKERFTDKEDCSIITIKTLKNSNLKVSSFRLPVQFDDLDKITNASATETTIESFTESDVKSRMFEDYVSPEATDDASSGRPTIHINLYDKLRKMGNQGLRKIKLFQKVEALKVTREKRKYEWTKFLVSEPRLMVGGDTEDEVIREAKVKLGDMKLKTTVGDKVLLEKQKLTLEKSSKALNNHFIQEIQLKKSFNNLLLQLRDRKRSVINYWMTANSKLTSLKKVVPDSLAMKLPTIDMAISKEEYPELRFQSLFTSQKVEFQESLFVQTIDEEGAPQQEDEPVTINDLEDLLILRDKIASTYEQQKIVADVNRTVDFFDSELSLLRSVKFCLDVYLKEGELRELLLLQEKMKMFEMLKEEEVLSSILHSKLKDEMELEKKIEELNQRIEKSLKEVAKLTTQQNQMEKNFLSTIPENYKFTEFLMKVYKQKVRRKVQLDYRSVADEDDDDEDEDLDEEEFDDDEENYDEEDDNYLNLDVCPEGCNIAVYEKTIQLRENRMDIMDKITENKRIKDAATKELEVKKKIVKNALDEAAKAALNLDLYQVAKLKAVNEFFTIVILTSRQIEFLDEENESMMADSSDMLVVDLHQLKFLERRIQQLENECQVQLKSIKETQEKHLFLTRSKARMTDRIDQADDEVKQAMKRKFGKMVNLEKIESILVSPALEELMYDFDVIKLKHLEEMQTLERATTLKESELSQEIKMNTDIMNYTLAYKDVAEELAADLSRTEEDLVIKRQANPVNLKETIQLVENQTMEILKLKREKYQLFYCPSIIKRF